MPINNEILEGIKYALTKGESFELAVSTFRNAGYPEDEISDAVSALKLDTVTSQNETKITQVKQESSVNFPSPSKSVSPQQISSYEQPPKQSLLQSKWFIIMLSIFLVVLLGALVSLFLFKDQITEFFSNLSG